MKRRRRGVAVQRRGDASSSVEVARRTSMRTSLTWSKAASRRAIELARAARSARSSGGWMERERALHTTERVLLLGDGAPARVAAEALPSRGGRQEPDRLDGRQRRLGRRDRLALVRPNVRAGPTGWFTQAVAPTEDEGAEDRRHRPSALRSGDRHPAPRREPPSRAAGRGSRRRRRGPPGQGHEHDGDVVALLASVQRGVHQLVAQPAEVAVRASDPATTRRGRPRPNGRPGRHRGGSR